jgi:hypothetical protein
MTVIQMLIAFQICFGCNPCPQTVFDAVEHRNELRVVQQAECGKTLEASEPDLGEQGRRCLKAGEEYAGADVAAFSAAVVCRAPPT